MPLSFVLTPASVYLTTTYRKAFLSPTGVVGLFSMRRSTPRERGRRPLMAENPRSLGFSSRVCFYLSPVFFLVFCCLFSSSPQCLLYSQ